MDRAEGRSRRLKDQYADLLVGGTLALPPEEIFPPRLWSAVRREALVRRAGRPGFEKELYLRLPVGAAVQQQDPLFPGIPQKAPGGRGPLLGLSLEPRHAPPLGDPLAGGGHPGRGTGASTAIPPQSSEVALLIGGLEQRLQLSRRRRSIFFSEKDIFTEEKVIVSRASRKAFFSQFQDLKAGRLCRPRGLRN